MNINIRSIVLIGIALIIAGIAAFLARSLINTPEGPQVAAGPQAPVNVEVLVSNKNIPTGNFLRVEDLEWQSWPDENININYTQKNSDQGAAAQIDNIVGSVAKLPIIGGVPIMNGQIVKPGTRGFMAAILTPGNRAVSININSKTGLSGFVFPGDMVDIILTHTVQLGEGEEKQPSQVSETVMKNIKILAIDTLMNNETNTPSIGKIATFEVTPKQAEKVTLLSRMGELSLALRSLAVEAENEEDEEVAKLMNNNAKTITFINEVSAVAGGDSVMGGAARKNVKVQVLRAGQTQELTFTDPAVNNR